MNQSPAKVKSQQNISLLYVAVNVMAMALKHYLNKQFIHVHVVQNTFTELENLMTE